MVKQLYRGCAEYATRYGYGIVPVDWKDVVVVYITKKGNLTESDNWRGVTLLSIPGKVYYHMILNRMRDMVEGELCEEQTGFRPKRSCAEQIFTLICIIETYQEYRLPLAISFIYFTKTFDSVHRPSVWKNRNHIRNSTKYCISNREDI